MDNTSCAQSLTNLFGEFGDHTHSVNSEETSKSREAYSGKLTRDIVIDKASKVCPLTYMLYLRS